MSQQEEVPFETQTRRPKAKLLVGRKQKNLLHKAKSVEDIKTFLDFRVVFNVSRDWDAILVTDGSATTWTGTAGWAGVWLRKDSLEPEPLFGLFSRGTNNVAELMAIFQAALTITEQDYGVKEHGYNLYVISDSKYAVDGLTHLSAGGEEGGTVWAAGQTANRPIWLGLLGCQRKGVVFHPRHVLRDKLATNKFCHNLANSARRAALQILQDLEQAPLDWSNK